MKGLLILLLLGGIIYLGLCIWAIIDLPDYMVSDDSGVSVSTAIKVESTKSEPKVITKTKVVKSKPTYKDKLDRFEEEAFWINVYDDDDY